MREWLKELRKTKGLVQSEVADKAGISRSYYTKIELGRKTPTVIVAKEIADVLEFNWIIFFEERCSLKEHKKLA